jgi:histidinol-phosphate aminotransferase
MFVRQAFTRRGFVGGLATALGYLGLEPSTRLWAQTARQDQARGPSGQAQIDEYDGFAKLANNENPYGASEPVLKRMNWAWKYSNRYGYPDGDITERIAEHHGVRPENIILGSGSGEILNVVGATFLEAGKKVVGVEPTYGSVYQYASGIRADAIRIPLLEDYRQNIPAMIRATIRNYRDVGFVYLCNPNNPTGRIVTSQEVRQLLDGIPEDMPVLIDEAYHHYIEDPAYATSVPSVLEGRRVIIARTFSKIYGLAGMRLGYAVAPPDLIQRMRNHGTGTINALVKWGGVAALADTESPVKIRKEVSELRRKTLAELQGLGYSVIPSETNFFMVHIRRPVQPVIAEFRKKGVLVGRPFPPMLEHLRVSIGTPDEMSRFMVAFKQIFTGATTATGSRNGH